VVTTGLTAIERRIISRNMKPVWISPFLYQRHQGKRQHPSRRKPLLTVDTLNEMVNAGAYLGCRRRTIGNGTPESPEAKHTHEGSINNLCLLR
jgi:hypothetical protein